MYVTLGAIAGFISGLLGIGGGMIVVPALLMIFKLLNFPFENMMQMAIGTSLTAMIFTAGSSAWAHHKTVNWYIFKALIPGIFLGSILGAMIAHILPTEILQVIFGIFLCVLGTYFLLTAKIKEVEATIKPDYFIIHLMGLMIGSISSILGIGGGIITVPMLLMLGTSMQNAISTSATTGFLIATVGALSFLFLGLTEESNGTIGYVYIPAFVVIGLTAAIMAPLGAKYSYSTSTVVLKRIFGIYQIVIGILMVIFQ